MPWVVDASSFVEVLLRSDTGNEIAELLANEELHAPDLLDLAVLSVLHKSVATQALSPERAERAGQRLVSAPIERATTDVLIDEVWALRKQLTTSDASDVALANTWLGGPDMRQGNGSASLAGTTTSFPCRTTRWLVLAEEGFGERVVLRGDGAKLRDAFREGNRDHVRTTQRSHLAELAPKDEVRGEEPKASRKDPVVGRRRATTLNMAKDRGASLVARPLFDLLGKTLSDPTKTLMPKGIDLARRRREPLLASLVGNRPALTHDDDRKVLAPVLVAVADNLCATLDRHGELWNEHNIRTARDAACDRDPTGVSPHDLDDDHAVVGLSGGVNPIDRLGDDLYRGIEPKRLVGRSEIVVDGLRDADYRKALFVVESVRDAECVVATDRNERIELVEPATHRLDATVGRGGVCAA
jgi:predicted nucleic acid-binding protein